MAEVSLVVGVKRKDVEEVLNQLDTWDYQDFLKLLPKGVMELNSDGSLSRHLFDEPKTECLEKFGCLLEVYDPCDELVGIGHEIFKHDWNFAPESVDLEKLIEERDKFIPIVQKVFDETGYKLPVSLWMTSDDDN